LNSDIHQGANNWLQVVSAVSEELTNQVEFYSVDVDPQPDLAQQFGVKAIQQ
jgi:thioredoxin-like negative regulator of GroEL